MKIAIVHYDLPKTNWHADILQNVTYRYLKELNIYYNIIFHGEELSDIKRADIIDISEWCNHWHQNIAQKYSIPIICSTEECSITSLRNYLSTNNIDVQFMLSRISHFIARSSLSKEMLIKFGIDENKISVLSYGIDLDIFKPSEKYHEKSFLYVGSINKQKGVHHLIDAYLKIIDKTDWKLKLCIGEFNNDIDLLENIKTLSKKFNKIQLTPFPHTNFLLVDIYQKSSCFCLIQDKDSPAQFSYPSLWALSCGLPIISLNIGALKDYVKNEENGFLCDEIDQLPEKMLEIVRRDLDTSTMRKISRMIAENDHDPQKLAIKYKNICTTVINEE